MGGATAALAAGGLGLRRAARGPEGWDETTDFLTDASVFYDRFQAKKFDPMFWYVRVARADEYPMGHEPSGPLSLSIEGAVERSMTWTEDELRARLLGSLLRAGTKRVTFVQVVPIHTPDGARDRAMKDLLAYAADAAAYAARAAKMTREYNRVWLVNRSCAARRTCDEQREPKKALKLFMMAAHLTRRDAQLWRRLAEMSVREGEPEQAIYCLGRVKYGLDYSTGGPDARRLGGIISHVGDMPLFFMAVYHALKLAGFIGA